MTPLPAPVEHNPCSRPLLRAGLALLMAVSACSTPAPVAEYDLGMLVPPSPALRLPAAVVAIQVQAPSWLDDGALHYRLAYADGAQLRQYAGSRWVAAPARLLEQRLRSALAQGTGASAERPPAGAARRLQLRVELSEFTQVFDTPAQSHALVQAMATLTDPHGTAVIARQGFTVQRVAAQADATGAVASLRGAAEALLEQIAAWLAAQPPG